MTDQRVAEVLTHFAARFHRAIGATHHVASPLGAWLLLALITPAASQDRRQALEDALGCPAEEADATARTLLTTEHPALRLAAAAWSRTRSADLDAWLDGLRSVADVGAMPTQAGADAWADEHTGGLITQFPIEMTADLLLVLASAIACDVEWVTPFATVDTDGLQLPRDAAFAGLRTMLRSPAECLQLIASTPLGPVAVHAAESADHGLLVVSVIAAAHVGAAEVLAHAQPIAVALALGDEPDRVSLFDLPLGEGPAWTLTERPASRDEERVRTVLPAWSAQSRHDLTDATDLGIPDGLVVLADLADGNRGRALQSAVARYTRTGFQAAAVTGTFTAARAVVGQRGRRRIAEVEFGRPYAVVAVGRDPSGKNAGSPWNGLPVFSAWIAVPDESDEADAGG